MIQCPLNCTFFALTTLVPSFTYMGGTRPCGPITITFGSIIESQYTSLNFIFGVNRTLHVLKNQVTKIFGSVI